MFARLIVPIITVAMMLGSVLTTRGEEKSLTVTEFRQLYDNLLAGKTLLSEIKENGAVIKKERHYGKAIDSGDVDFEIPIKMMITKTKGGKLDLKVTVDILDRVHDLGGQVIVAEEAREITVEEEGSKPREASEVEFGGLFVVAKNEKGGFDVHSLGLIPSLLVEEDKTRFGGAMVSYSCFPDDGEAKCVLTIRDYELGKFEPLVGYKLLEPFGDDYVEVAEEVRPKN